MELIPLLDFSGMITELSRKFRIHSSQSIVVLNAGNESKND
jgi:hypothetical protein